MLSTFCLDNNCLDSNAVQLAAPELEKERLTLKKIQLTGQPSPELRRNRYAQELATREIELATRWLGVIMRAEGLEAFKDRGDVKMIITSKVVEFYVGRQRTRKS